MVKDPHHIGEGHLFPGTDDSLSERTEDGVIASTDVAPGVSGLQNFHEEERITKRLLAEMTWAELREGRERSYWRVAAPSAAVCASHDRACAQTGLSGDTPARPQPANPLVRVPGSVPRTFAEWWLPGPSGVPDAGL